MLPSLGKPDPTNPHERNGTTWHGTFEATDFISEQGYTFNPSLCPIVQTVGSLIGSHVTIIS